MPDFDAAIIGAGAVGLATAAALAQAGRSVVVLEQADHPGEGTSSRNSEVIHAGLSYATGSLKHELCIRGRRQLYAFLETHGVPFNKCGKLVVATDASELAKIEALLERGQVNGVEGLALLSAAEIAALEPEVVAVGGLMVPETGIFDSHQYYLALIGEIEAHDGSVALRTPFVAAEPTANGFEVRTGGDDPFTFTTAALVNSAGLWAPAVARRIAGLRADTIPTYHFAKGSYFHLTGHSPFRHLVYPAPVDGGLGVHATLDLTGNTRFGPDVEWLPEVSAPEQIDYIVDLARSESFYAAIRRYWPGLADGKLAQDYSGCRPKLSGPGSVAEDFGVQGADVGIESPGLTASLAIGELVAPTRA